MNLELDSLLHELARLAEVDHGIPVVVASVNQPVAAELEQRFNSRSEQPVLRIGRDIPFSGKHSLDDASTVGHDRILNAMGAYSRAAQACIVIDAGTAVTVDFVDGEGNFNGGVIAPGVHMMLRALHERTSALPLVDLHRPERARGVFGKDTRHAIMLGVIGAVQGLARLMIERYSESYGAYPQVIATGGDAPLLFEDDEVIEHIVPDLQLLGIREAFLRAADAAEEPGA
jgi:type III pantothenate kinase